ncbi:hypothetical protein PoB_003943100 [Plakobranchus ocellatus]|uniref:Uncharacterized protein n=1 Tax=Plakobranchus ocellatus TaxID=259542 RepID=A0AAV4AP46_9GAST|nr:hypothetical protein PoB_003943100 [Plakobranchus ocellatus]
MNIFLCLVAVCISTVASDCDSYKNCTRKLMAENYHFLYKTRCDLPRHVKEYRDSHGERINCTRHTEGCNDRAVLDDGRLEAYRSSFLLLPYVEHLILHMHNRCQGNAHLINQVMENKIACYHEGVGQVRECMSDEDICDLVAWSVKCSTDFVRDACGRQLSMIAYSYWVLFIRTKFFFCMYQGYIPYENVY